MPVRGIGQAGPNKRRVRTPDTPEVAKARQAAVDASVAVVKARADHDAGTITIEALQAAEDAVTAANQALRDAVAGPK